MPHEEQLVMMYERERALRLSTIPLLDKPFARTDFVRRAFRCSTPTVWNSLPETIISVDSLSVFKSRLKTYFFRKAFEQHSQLTCRQRLWSQGLEYFINRSIIIIVIDITDIAVHISGWFVVGWFDTWMHQCMSCCLWQCHIVLDHGLKSPDMWRWSAGRGI